MVRASPRACALVGRLASPAPEQLGGNIEEKAKDFFREVGNLARPRQAFLNRSPFSASLFSRSNVQTFLQTSMQQHVLLLLRE